MKSYPGIWIKYFLLLPLALACHPFLPTSLWISLINWKETADNNSWKLASLSIIISSRQSSNRLKKPTRVTII